MRFSIIPCELDSNGLQIYRIQYFGANAILRLHLHFLQDKLLMPSFLPTPPRFLPSPGCIPYNISQSNRENAYSAKINVAEELAPPPFPSYRMYSSVRAGRFFISSRLAVCTSES